MTKDDKAYRVECVARALFGYRFPGIEWTTIAKPHVRRETDEFLAMLDAARRAEEHIKQRARDAEGEMAERFEEAGEKP